MSLNKSEGFVAVVSIKLSFSLCHFAEVHTMDELKMTGNCLKGSRPLLSFDPVR